MYIDDPRRELLYELRRQDLHVSGENDQIDVARNEELQLLRLGLSSRFRLYRNEVEIDSVELGQRFGFAMIADDHRNGAMKLTGLMPVEDIGEAVQVLRYEDRDARTSGVRRRRHRIWSSVAVFEILSRNAVRSNPSSDHSTRMKNNPASWS